MTPSVATEDMALYLEGLRRFNAGAFYASHEALEDLWLRNRSAARSFYQGLIQVAAACHHADAGRRVPMAALFKEATARLRPFTPAMLGVDVAHLLLEIEAARRQSEVGPHPAEPRHLQAIKLRYSPPTPDEFRPHGGVAPHPLGPHGNKCSGLGV